MVDLVTYVPGRRSTTSSSRRPNLMRHLRDATRPRAPRADARQPARVREAGRSTRSARRASSRSRSPTCPSGFFDNASLETLPALATSSGAACRTTSACSTGTRGVELYIVAMNLDTAERVVFGHDEDTSLTISEAVQASTALPASTSRRGSRASTTSTAACAARRTSTSRSSTAPTSSSATTRSARSRTASCGASVPEQQPLRARGPAARRPGHADGAEPGVPHAAPLAPPARHPRSTRTIRTSRATSS